MRTKRPGFTLAELLVVIVIISLVLFTLVPGLLQLRVNALESYGKNNLKQIGLAVQNANLTFSVAPPMFGEFGASQSGSFWFHLLPFLEQDHAYRMGPVKSKDLSFKSLQSPKDPTLMEPAVFELKESSYLPFAGNPIPEWAANSSPNWGLCSYGANWMVFGDSARPLETTVSDGLSQTIIVTEKYALTRQSSGAPSSGASLWAYGWQVPRAVHQWAREPEHLKKPDSVLQSLYAAPYWARSCFVDRDGSDKSSWAGDQPWEFRNHLKPQFAPPVNESNPFREQANTPYAIQVLNGDGSVATIGPSISDRSWFARTTPDERDLAVDP